jgi:hypothetical protein
MAAAQTKPATGNQARPFVGVDGFAERRDTMAFPFLACGNGLR